MGRSGKIHTFSVQILGLLGFGLLGLPPVQRRQLEQEVFVNPILLQLLLSLPDVTDGEEHQEFKTHNPCWAADEIVSLIFPSVQI